MNKVSPVFSLAGGFLFLARNGAGELSIDNYRSGAVASTS